MILIDPQKNIVMTVDRTHKKAVGYTAFEQPVALKVGHSIVGYYQIGGSELNAGYWDGEDAVDHLMRFLEEPTLLDVINGEDFDTRFTSLMHLLEKKSASLVVRTAEGQIAYCDYEDGHRYLDVLIIEEPELISGENRLSRTQALERNQVASRQRVEGLGSSTALFCESGG